MVMSRASLLESSEAAQGIEKGFRIPGNPLMRGPIALNIDLPNSLASREEWVTAFRRAERAWNNILPLPFRGGQPQTVRVVLANLGAGTKVADSFSPARRIRLNSRFAGCSGGSIDTLSTGDKRHFALHELGHQLGLGHTQTEFQVDGEVRILLTSNSSTEESVMRNGCGFPGTLGADDIRSVEELYRECFPRTRGCSGSSALTCNSSGTEVIRTFCAHGCSQGRCNPRPAPTGGQCAWTYTFSTRSGGGGGLAGHVANGRICTSATVGDKFTGPTPGGGSIARYTCIKVSSGGGPC